MQETSNIIEDTFQHITFVRVEFSREINKGTAWGLGSEKYIKGRTRF